MDEVRLKDYVDDLRSDLRISSAYPARLFQYLEAVASKDKKILPILDSSFFASSQKCWVTKNFEDMSKKKKARKRTRGKGKKTLEKNDSDSAKPLPVFSLPTPTDSEERDKLEILWNRLITASVTIMEHEHKLTLGAEHLDKAILFFSKLHVRSKVPEIKELSAEEAAEKTEDIFHETLDPSSACIEL